MIHTWTFFRGVLAGDPKSCNGLEEPGDPAGTFQVRPVVTWSPPGCVAQIMETDPVEKRPTSVVGRRR